MFRLRANRTHRKHKFAVPTAFSLGTFLGNSSLLFPRSRLARGGARSGSGGLGFPARDVIATSAPSPRACGTSFWIQRWGPACAGPHFRNQNVAPRARDPVAVSVSTPRACAGPRRGVRDDPPRVRDLIFGTAAGSRARGTPSRFRFHPSRTCETPSGIPRRPSARAGPRRGSRFGVPHGVWAVVSRENAWFLRVLTPFGAICSEIEGGSI